MIERCDRRLRRRRFIRKARSVGRTAAGKDLPLHLLQLPFEPFDALLRRWLLALRKRRGGRNEGDCGDGRQRRNQSKFHVVGPQPFV